MRAITSPNIYILLYTDHDNPSALAFSGRVMTGSAPPYVPGAGNVGMFLTLFNNGYGNALTTNDWFPSLQAIPLKTYVIVGLSKQAVMSELGRISPNHMYPLNTHAISGRITHGGVGLANALVTATWQGSVDAASATALTDQNGYYAIYGLADGPYVVEPYSYGYTFSPTSSTPTIAGSNITINFTASP